MEMKRNEKTKNKKKNNKLMKWKRTTTSCANNKMQWMIEYNNNETFIKKKQKINNCVFLDSNPLPFWPICFPENMKETNITTNKLLKQKITIKKK